MWHFLKEDRLVRVRAYFSPLDDALDFPEVCISSLLASGFLSDGNMMEISIHAWLITRLPVLMEPLQLVSPIILAVSPIFLGRRVCVGGDRFDLCSQTVRSFSLSAL